MFLNRSSRPEVFFKVGVRENFAKFTGKHLCISFFCNFIKKETLAQVLSSKFCLIFKSNIFYRKPSGDCSCRVNIYDSLSHFVLEKKLIWEMSSFFISFWKENSIIYSQGESKFQDIPDWGNGSTYSSSSHFNCTIHCEKSFLKFSWIS